MRNRFPGALGPQAPLNAARVSARLKRWLRCAPVAEIALAFRMNARVFDPAGVGAHSGVELVPDLATLLGTSDVVSLHVPLTPSPVISSMRARSV